PPPGGGAQPTSIAFTLRNRIVLTMTNPGTSTIGTASAATRGSWRPHGYRKTVEAVTEAAAGLGRPAKCRLPVPAMPGLSTPPSRSAAAVTYTNPAAQPNRPSGHNPQVN